MMALIFEVMGAIDLIMAVYFWNVDHADIDYWLFFLMLSVIMYMNASRYEETE